MDNVKITKDAENIKILFVGHNIYLSDNMCSNIKREDVLYI